MEHVVYVGNPLTNEVSSSISKVEFCRSQNLDSGRPIISLLPGSRYKEIIRMLPVMLDAAARLSEERSGAQFVIAIASEGNRADVDDIISRTANLPKTLRIVENQTYDAVAASDAAAVTSGTATLETGILGTPMVIVYKSTTLNYILLRPLISVQHYGLINLIAEERVAKELIQNQFSPTAVAMELRRLLDAETNTAFREKLREVRKKLGTGGASKRAAEAILNFLEKGSA